MAKNRILGVRLDNETWERVKRLEELTKIDKSTIARACIGAAIDYIEEKKEITFPLKITTNAEFEAMKAELEALKTVICTHDLEDALGELLQPTMALAED